MENNKINNDWQQVFKYLDASAQSYGYSSFNDFICLNFDSRIAKEKMFAKILQFAEELQQTAFQIETENFLAEQAKINKRLDKQTFIAIGVCLLLALGLFLIKHYY